VIARRAGVAALSLVVAIACGRGEQRDAQVDSTGPALAGGSTGASTTPVVTTHGIGPLRAGMTIAEASAALGGALVVSPDADTLGCDYLEWRGGPPGVEVMVEGGRIARVDVDSAGIRTADGVGLGDAEADVLRRYGARARVSVHKYDDEGHYVTVVDPKDTTFALVFETSAGRVTRYRAGRRPAVEYVEGCS